MSTRRVIRQHLGEIAQESTRYIVLDWKKFDGTAGTPTAATWSLTDVDGNAINSRTDVTISGLSTQNLIRLTGDDLAFQESEDGLDRVKRLVKVEFTIESDPCKAEMEFYIQKVVAA